MYELKKKIKEFFKNPKEVISFFFPIILAFILIIPVPYYITVGGGTLDINDKIKIDNEYQEKGSLKAAYVKEMKGNIFSYLLGKIVPDYEVTKVEDVVLDNDEKEDYEHRERLMFDDSLDVALKVVFDYLDKDIEIIDRDMYVTYIDEKAITTLKPFDIIKEIEQTKINTNTDILEVLNKYIYKDEIHIKVLRGNEEIITTSQPIMFNDERKLGIYLGTKYKYKTDPKVTFNFSNNEAGPSGGLILSLNIYNKLTSNDITKGKIIVGTGALDREGNVLEIGGVKYKLMGAVKDHADIFIVPKANYKEAHDYAIKKNLKIKIISVSTFEETLKILESIN